MSEPRAAWINVLGSLVGGLALGYGAYEMITEFSLVALVWAILGFLVLGWAVFDLRRFRRGTPESEVDGGHTIE